MPKAPRQSMRQRRKDAQIIQGIRRLIRRRDARTRRIITRLKYELIGTDDRWTGAGVPITGLHFVASEAERAQVQVVGRAHGCHECLTKIATDRTQPWIGDHIPPVHLKASEAAKVRTALGLADGTYRLYPQCDACASEQATLVRSQRVAGLSAKETKLLRGGTNDAAHFIITHSPIVGASTDRIQTLGRTNGCHSCPAKVPATTYHADHCPPQSINNRHDAELVLEAAGIDLDAPNLRPHCPKCSHRQGGRMNGVDNSIRQLVRMAQPIGPGY